MHIGQQQRSCLACPSRRIGHLQREISKKNKFQLKHDRTRLTAAEFKDVVRHDDVGFE